MMDLYGQHTPQLPTALSRNAAGNINSAVYAGGYTTANSTVSYLLSAYL